MSEVPKMISTKDLLYIEDMMNWNMVYSKKCHMYKSMISNSEIKKFVDTIAKMHTEHYEKFLNIINN